MIDTVFQGKTGILGTYLITGDRTALIDPGPPVQATQVLEILKQLGVKINLIALTHIHLDHAAGTWDILQEHSKCKVIVHPRGSKHLVDPTNLLEAALSQFKGEMPPYGEVNPVPHEVITESEEGMILDLGDTKLLVIWTSGHSTHSQSFFEPENGLLFTGDAAGQIVFDQVIPASPPPFNPEQTIESIEHMINLKPTIICISHFGYRENAVSYLSDFRDRVELWKRLSFEAIENGGGLRDLFELVHSNDKIIKKLIELHPEAKSDIYSSLVGFISYAKWKNNQK